MTTDPPPALSGRGRSPLGRLGVIAGFLLGTMAAGILVNLLSDNPTCAARALVAGTGLAAAARERQEER
ncbi:hypothetical protein [Actinoplanes sp. NPDC020271]|uniref:hypothetical protein n=1 Tax=Actinoplanes sp. NPDC020271 TaxID=3363896 RepID=UPI00378ED16E